MASLGQFGQRWVLIALEFQLLLVLSAMRAVAALFSAIHPNVANCGSAEKNTCAMLRGHVFVLNVIGRINFGTPLLRLPQGGL